MEETKDSGSEPKYEDYGTLFVVSEAEKADYSNLDYLKKNVYIVDSSTGVLDGELNGEKFLNEDFSIDTDTDGLKYSFFTPIPMKASPTAICPPEPMRE